MASRSTVLNHVSAIASLYRELCDDERLRHDAAASLYNQRAELCSQKIHAIRRLREQLREEERATEQMYLASCTGAERCNVRQQELDAEVNETMTAIEAVDLLPTLESEEVAAAASLRDLAEQVKKVQTDTGATDRRCEELRVAEEQAAMKEEAFRQRGAALVSVEADARQREVALLARDQLVSKKEAAVQAWLQNLDEKEREMQQSLQLLQRRLLLVASDESSLGIIKATPLKQQVQEGRN